MPEPAVLAALGLTTAAVLLATATARTWSRIIRSGRPRRALPLADTILIFGAETYASGVPCPELAARLRHAAALYRNGRAGTIVCSGGHPGPESEPRVMRTALVQLGVPREAVLIDESGKTTRRSIATAKRLGSGRWQLVLVVSSPYHIHRILTEARRQSLNVLPAPPTGTPIMTRFLPRTRQQMREVAAAWWYAVSARRTRRARKPSPNGLLPSPARSTPDRIG